MQTVNIYFERFGIMISNYWDLLRICLDLLRLLHDTFIHKPDEKKLAHVVGGRWGGQGGGGEGRGRAGSCHSHPVHIIPPLAIFYHPQLSRCLILPLKGHSHSPPVHITPPSPTSHLFYCPQLSRGLILPLKGHSHSPPVHMIPPLSIS